MAVKLYGPVVAPDTVVGEISPTNGCVDSFDGNIFWAYAENLLDTTKTLDYLTVTYSGPGRNWLVLATYTDGSDDSSGYFNGATKFSLQTMADMGIIPSGSSTVTNIIISFEPGGYKSKEVKKLYGSVLNVSSLGSYTTQSASVPTFVPNEQGDIIDLSIFLPKLKEKFPYWADQYSITYPQRLKISDFYEVLGGTGGMVDCAIYFYGRDISRSIRLLYSYTTSTLSDFISYCSSWGLTINPNIQSESTSSGTGCDFPNATMENMSKKIVRLYGSVNGQSKLIYKEE